MPDLNEYDVVINGMKTRLKLSDEDAKRYPEAKKAASSKRAPAPANKSASTPSQQ